MATSGWTAIRIWILCLLLAMPATALARPIRVAFVAPSPMARPFWNDYVSFMKVAAKSLEIDLNVAVAENRYDVPDLIREVVYGEAKPDYLVFIYQAHTTILGLKIAQEAEVKSLLVNTGVMDLERTQVGQPRGKFPLWIGHIYPDDIKAGRQLAQLLVQKAQEEGLRDRNGQIHLLGIGGNLVATSSTFRKAGLTSALREYPDVVMDRFVLGYWQRDISGQKTGELIDLHPEARVVWAINDNTALGVLDAIRSKGLTPGKDILTGGIDWTPQCIEEIRNGSMVASLGGHFMEGAWALIMLVDYHNGHDFAQPDPTLRSEMRTIDQETMDDYLPIIDRDNWERIDFKRFSKTYNPDLTEYDFSPDAVVHQLNRR